MDDDVLEITKVCAQTMGHKVHLVHTFDGKPLWMYVQNGQIYEPATDPAQAFELLCWLAERGTVHFELGFRFEFYPKDGEAALGYACTDAAELRLAIMRAVCKVKEGK